ncbi:unnamed protein product [Citrullus colocynthis]|uniref:Uncharacterized protein n=1 Tax=Citrullus colocynthis TaxID=252529 RepID=A0ABP0YY10_9ROSI
MQRKHQNQLRKQNTREVEEEQKPASQKRHGYGGGNRKKNRSSNISRLIATKRESLGTAEREPPERASFVDFSKKSSISAVLMFALHAFLPLLDPFDFFPIAPKLKIEG